GSSFDFTADPNATEVNVPQRIEPAKQETVEKSDKQTVPATGKKNVGDKATCSISMTSQICNRIVPPSSVPSGTVNTANSQKYVTQQAVDFSFKNISGGCINYSSNGTKVVAQDPGTAANTGATTFSV